MLAEIEYGKLKTQHEKITNPFELLEWSKTIKMSAWDFLEIADKYFGTRMQCDWGSFYWQCKKSDLKQFLDEQKIELPDFSTETDNEEEYGVVFIEMS